MQILNNRPPELNPNDVEKSFREITRYLTSTMEAIDFNLAKNRRNIMASDSSSAGLQSQLDQIKSDTVLLENGLNAANNQLNSISENISSIDLTLKDLAEKVSSLEKRVSVLEENAP